MGIGVVKEYNAGYIIVQFSNKEIKFIYPDAFEKFLKAQDNSIQTAIIQEIQASKLSAEENKKMTK